MAQDATVGATVVATASADGAIKLWRITTDNAELMRAMDGHSAGVNALAWSSAARLLASGSADGSAMLWREGGELERQLVGHNDSVASVAFSRDGERLVTASHDTTVRLWQIADSPAKVYVFEGHSAAVQHVAFSRSGLQFASASHDGSVRLWPGLVKSDAVESGARQGKGKKTKRAKQPREITPD